MTSLRIKFGAWIALVLLGMGCAGLRATPEGPGREVRFQFPSPPRTGRTVEVSIGRDHMKVTGVTSQQQGEIIDAWLARHGPGR